MFFVSRDMVFLAVCYFGSSFYAQLAKQAGGFLATKVSRFWSVRKLLKRIATKLQITEREVVASLVSQKNQPSPD